MNISPDCDCWSTNDVPLVNDIGILASFDPVAIDRACIDMVNKAIVNPGSKLNGKNEYNDVFISVHPNTDWRRCLDYAQQIGIGNQNYELVNV